MALFLHTKYKGTQKTWEKSVRSKLNKKVQNRSNILWLVNLRQNKLLYLIITDNM